MATRELLAFFWSNRWWWLTPMVVVLLLPGFMVLPSDRPGAVHFRRG
jgi:hypothetical protein